MEDINPWGALWQIIVGNILLFHNQFFELFSVEVSIQNRAWIAPQCEIRILVSFSSCDMAQGLGIAVEIECANVIW